MPPLATRRTGSPTSTVSRASDVGEGSPSAGSASPFPLRHHISPRNPTSDRGHRGSDTAAVIRIARARVVACVRRLSAVGSRSISRRRERRAREADFLEMCALKTMSVLWNLGTRGGGGGHHGAASPEPRQGSPAARFAPGPAARGA